MSQIATAALAELPALNEVSISRNELHLIIEGPLVEIISGATVEQQVYSVATAIAERVHGLEVSSNSLISVREWSSICHVQFDGRPGILKIIHPESAKNALQADPEAYFEGLDPSFHLKMDQDTYEITSAKKVAGYPQIFKFISFQGQDAEKPVLTAILMEEIQGENLAAIATNPTHPLRARSHEIEAALINTLLELTKFNLIPWDHSPNNFIVRENRGKIEVVCVDGGAFKEASDKIAAFDPDRLKALLLQSRAVQGILAGLKEAL